ncbi:ABC transporter substrate-binding protein [Gloeocapsopsis sp. IPPAS B-1203]|nr:ABC transporter substrate-binding protein [Gloeocapsopsis sp. IPPAS B-1203]
MQKFIIWLDILRLHNRGKGRMAIQQRYQRVLKFFVLLNFAILTISACGISSYRELEAVSNNCRIIAHAMGDTCVPLNPQRVVVWGGTELDPVLALGVKPIAGTPNVLTYVKEKLPSEQWQGIEDISNPQGPNLERLLKLKPDLILGHKSRIEQVYPQLSKIAPTVLDGADDWKSTLRLFAEALGKTDKAQQVMDTYDARIKRFKAEMSNQLPFTISAIEVRADAFVLSTKDSFAMSVIQEAGLSLPPALTQYTWRTWTLSKERLYELESDALFLRSWGEVGKEQYKAQSQLEKLKTDPLWMQLQVVQQNKVYEVGDYFQGAGPITANFVLDDLFKHLITTQS